MITGDGGPLIFLHAMDLPSILFRSRHECRGGEANILCPVQLFILPFCHQLEHVAAIEVGNSSTKGVRVSQNRLLVDTNVYLGSSNCFLSTWENMLGFKIS